MYILDDYSHGGYESSEGSDDCSLEVSCQSLPEDICYGDHNSRIGIILKNQK